MTVLYSTALILLTNGNIVPILINVKNCSLYIIHVLAVHYTDCIENSRMEKLYDITQQHVTITLPKSVNVLPNNITFFSFLLF